ncbi:UDP-glucose dehydrogenase family protein [Cohnella sp. GCM10020058]|uniref:UDP-glucose dehydrogenase family protein n=1 Tax=Cohnella sp. GCM10020058 TaxID=3317330 RepID=UPI003633ED00
MKVAILGTGYVGLTTGACFAYIGHQVVCVDVDEKKIQGIREGRMPFHEEHLHGLIRDAQDRITFICDCEEAVRDADVVILAVGTPQRADGSPELAYLESAVESVLNGLTSKQTVTLLVNKSTAPVGTCDRIAARAADRGLAGKVIVASNPEFLRQGRAVHDTLYPERIVIGGSDVAVNVLERMYAPLVEQNFHAPEFLPRPEAKTASTIIAVDIRSAEIGKYAANAYLAMKISFINELANLSDRIGADIKKVADIVGSDSRIGPSFLQAGIGYGGSCFPKDTRALRHIAGESGYDFKLLSAVIEVNRLQQDVVIEKIKREYPDLSGKRIAVLGLSFKPGTDDLRESPSLGIIESLLLEGANVIVHDPVALPAALPKLSQRVHAAASAEEAIEGADAAILVTEWSEYTMLDGATIAGKMRRPLFIDGRNAMPASFIREVEYIGIGTGTRQPALIS